jgi:hypothetical protein
VYKNTLSTVKRQLQQAEYPTPTVVISVEVVRVDNDILLHHLASEVVLEEPEIASTDPNIPIDNNCTNGKLCFGMPGGSGDHEDDGNESDERNAFPTASQRRRPTIDLERFYLRTTDIDGYDGDDGNDVDADANDEDGSSQADDGSTQNLED